MMENYKNYIDDNIDNLESELIILCKKIKVALNDSYNNFLDINQLTKIINNMISETILLFLDVPIISKISTFLERSNIYWLVNPFCNQTLVSSINISLIFEDTPYIGCIYIPSSNFLYFSKRFCIPKIISINTQTKLNILCHTKNYEDKELRVIINHNFKNNHLVNILNVPKISYTDSILSLLTIINNHNDIVFNDNGVMEWDLAPLDLIINESGGKVRDLSRNLIKYNSENFKINTVYATCGL